MSTANLYTTLPFLLIALLLFRLGWALWKKLTQQTSVEYDNPTGFLHAGYKSKTDDLDNLASRLLMDENSNVWRSDQHWFYTNLHNPDDTVLWLGFDDYMKPGTVQLSYRSIHKNPLMIIGKIPDPNQFMEGSLLAIHTLFLQPTAIYFDCPVYRMTSLLNFPFYADISLCAFPLTLDLIAPDNISKTRESLPESLTDIQYSVHKKIPKTRFESQIYEYENSGSHLSIAEFIGYIVDCKIRRNHVTRKSFYVITAYTSGLFIDIVAEKRKLRMAPEKGMIVATKCRLSGELFSVKIIKSLNQPDS